MRILRFNESSHASNLHFGKHVLEYFPWYTYPDSINNKPKLDKDKYEIYRNAFSSRYSIMSYVWYTSNTVRREIGNNLYTDDPHLVETGGPWTTSISSNSLGANSLQHTIFVEPDKNLVTISGTENDVEDWEDIEKLRLMYNLGRRHSAEDYLDILKFIDGVYDILEYYLIDSKESGYNFNFTLSNFEDMIQRDYTLTYSDEILIDFIDKYSGDNRFYSSLKSYYHKTKELTFRQLESIKKTVPKEIMKIQKNKPCIIIGDNGHQSSALYRFKKLGYEISEENFGIVIL